MEALAVPFPDIEPMFLFAGLCVVTIVVIALMIRDLSGNRLAWSRPLSPFQYTRRLARKGDAKACVACADMLEKGTGGAPYNPQVAQSYLDQALEIYQRDAKRGEGYGWLKMGEIYARGHLVRDMPAEADRCFRKAFLRHLEAAKGGDVNGCAYAGYQLRYGLGCIADPARAMDYLETAAGQGHAPSMKSLAELYLMPVRGKPDPVKAAQWFRAAAAQGDAEALERVGDNFASASGEPISYEKAYFCYAGAARKGRVAAQRKMQRLEEGWTPKQVRDIQDRLQSAIS